MADYKKLKVWAKPHALLLNVDRAAMRIRESHRAGRRSQMLHGLIKRRRAK
jgi:hypothetical protein